MELHTKAKTYERFFSAFPNSTKRLSDYLCDSRIDYIRSGEIVSRIYHYSSSTVIITHFIGEYRFELKVCSDNKSKVKEVFGKLEKVLLGRK